MSASGTECAVHELVGAHGVLLLLRLAQRRFVDGVASRVDEAELRQAQHAKDAIRAYELVYGALGGE